MSTTDPQEPGRRRPITFTVDGEPITTTEAKLTPDQILKLAEIDPALHYLEQVDGREHVSYQGKGDEPIHLHEDEMFVSIPTGPTQTS